MHWIWQIKIFGHFLHAAVINASILYNSDRNRTSNEELTLFRFQLALAVSLCSPTTDNNLVEEDENYEDAIEINPQTPEVGKNPKFKTKKERWIVEFGKRNTGKHAPKRVKYEERRCCVICSERAQYKCEQCDVFLHIMDHNSSKGCWKRFHDDENPFLW